MSYYISSAVSHLMNIETFWIFGLFDYESMKKHGHSGSDVKGVQAKPSVHCLCLSSLFSRIYCLQMLTVCNKMIPIFFFLIRVCDENLKEVT